VVELRRGAGVSRTPSQLYQYEVFNWNGIVGCLKARVEGRFHLPCEPPRPTLNIIRSCGLFEGKGVSTSRVSPPDPLFSFVNRWCVGMQSTRHTSLTLNAVHERASVPRFCFLAMLCEMT
jgi:hypothetical protein